LRFEREAQSAASLSHPNIVAIYRVGRLSNDLPYFIMQYVKGRTMADRIKAKGALPLDEARRAIGEVASAVAAAHQKGIVHRDIRPGNVLYEEDSGRALLADFGIAAIVASGDMGESARLTRTGELVGDPSYMSPEQLMGMEVTERSDVYAIGLLGYELVKRRTRKTLRTATGRRSCCGRSARPLFGKGARASPRCFGCSLQLERRLARDDADAIVRWRGRR
jgi:serine/threonine-protein kinase